MSGKTNASKAAHRATRKSRRQAGEDPEVPPPPDSGNANSPSVSDSGSVTTPSVLPGYVSIGTDGAENTKDNATDTSDEFPNPEIDTYILEDSLAIDTVIPAPTLPSSIAPTAPAPTAVHVLESHLVRFVTRSSGDQRAKTYTLNPKRKKKKFDAFLIRSLSLSLFITFHTRFHATKAHTQKIKE